MDPNLTKEISRGNMPHCGNCFWFDGDDDDERLQFCDEREEYVARFGTCQKWRKKT